MARYRACKAAGISGDGERVEGGELGIESLVEMSGDLVSGTVFSVGRVWCVAAIERLKTSIDRLSGWSSSRHASVRDRSELWGTSGDWGVGDL